MDFIEKLFGISPDGGDGTTEFMFIAAAVAVALAVGAVAMRRRRA